jgi:hypothetical protein
MVYSPTGIGRPDHLIWMISIKIMLGYTICLSLPMINFISYPLFKIQLIPVEIRGLRPLIGLVSPGTEP